MLTVASTGVQETGIGEHSLFGKIYTNGLYTICVLILPFLLLLFFNMFIVNKLRVMKRHRQSLAMMPPRQQPGERSITIVMVTIVVVFLLCHTPDRVYQILRNFTTHPHCPFAIFFFSNSCNFLIILNSSINFVIYCMFRRRFRHILLEYICRGCGCKRVTAKPSPLLRMNGHTITSRKSLPMYLT